MAATATIHNDASPEAGLAHRLPDGPVLIAGGGIGGLAAALALAQRKIPSLVLERRDALGEAGAGIQIGPNGTRILEQLGVASLLRHHIATPRAIRVHDGRDGRALARLPLGRWIAERHGAPYWVAHRQDLHAALLGRARATPLIGLHHGAEVMPRMASRGPGVQVEARDGRRWQGSVLIGADGLWSSVRRAFSTAAPVHAGLSAVRTTIPAEATVVAERHLDIGVWMHPAGHVVHYPVRGGREVAVVGIFPDAPTGVAWDNEVSPAWIAERAAAFPAEVRTLLASDVPWRKWGLHALSGGTRWSDGNVALLGDSAHPVMPFLAQGAVLALEDAVVLAKAIAGEASVPQALRGYERLRRGRAHSVAAASRRNGRIYHLSGAMAAARNLGLATLSGERIMAGYDWLYGWRH